MANPEPPVGGEVPDRPRKSSGYSGVLKHKATRSLAVLAASLAASGLFTKGMPLHPYLHSFGRIVNGFFALTAVAAVHHIAFSSKRRLKARGVLDGETAWRACPRA